MQKISDKEYHSLNYLSASKLKEILKSPLHSTIKKEESQAMRFGTLAHMMFLEPDLFNKNKIISPKFDKRTTKGKEDSKAFQDSLNENLIVLTEEENEQLSQMSQMLNLDWDSRVRSGKSEIAIFWELPEEMRDLYNLPETKCKAKIDLLEKTESGFRIVEYKTTQDASKSEFTKQVANLKYHLSAAWYVWGLNLVTGCPMSNIEYVWLAQETKPPYDWAIYSATDETLQRGWERTSQALEKYSLALETNWRAGYKKELQDLTLPLWELSQFE